MKISTRIAIAFSVAGIALFGSYALYLVYQEEAELRTAAEREMHTLGRSLQASIEHALRDGQVEDVQGLLGRLASTNPAVRVFVYTASGDLIARTPRAAAESRSFRDAARAGLENGAARLSYQGPGDPVDLVSVLRLGEGEGVVVVARSLDDIHEDLRRTRFGISLSLVLFVLVAVGLGAFLGRVYIGWPLARLTLAMRNLRTGEMPLDLPVLARDELGSVTREFNELVHQLRQARERLQIELESRRQLEQAIQRADKLVTIGQLSAGVAHEIGSPLQVLSGRARALLANADDAEAARRHARIIVRETDRIARIVERLMQVSPRPGPRFGVVDLAETARVVVELLELEAARAAVTLRVDVVDALPPVRGDGDQLQQLLLNLVRNGLQATAAGGTVTVRIGEASGAKVRLEVSDTGSGMDPETEAQVFEPFFTTRRSEGGTGLGLPVVRAIVDEHHGTVEVQTVAGSGTRVTVTFPPHAGTDRASVAAGALG